MNLVHLGPLQLTRKSVILEKPITRSRKCETFFADQRLARNMVFKCPATYAYVRDTFPSKMRQFRAA